MVGQMADLMHADLPENGGGSGVVRVAGSRDGAQPQLDEAVSQRSGGRSSGVALHRAIVAEDVTEHAATSLLAGDLKLDRSDELVPVMSDDGQRIADRGTCATLAWASARNTSVALGIVRAPVRGSGRFRITGVAVYCLMIFDHKLP